LSKKLDRIMWIDIARGIGIILVIIGHVSRNQELQNFIYSFHMPLFFMLSGFLYKHKENFVKNKFKRLMIPYFVFSMLCFIYWVIIERNIRAQYNVSAFNQFINIFLCRGGEGNYIYNAAMWFLPCLFVTEIIFDFINSKLQNKSKIYLPILMLCSSILGYWYPKLTTCRLPFCMDIIFITIVFYYLGYIIKFKEQYIREKVNNPIKIILSLILMTVAIILSYIEKGMNLNNLIYNSYILLFVTAIIGVLGIYFISNVIRSKILNYISLNSLYIMCIHEPIKRVLIVIISKITKISAEVIRNNIILIISVSIITLIVCLIIIKVFRTTIECLNKKRERIT
jgi:acyltransferase